MKWDLKSSRPSLQPINQTEVNFMLNTIDLEYITELLTLLNQATANDFETGGIERRITKVLSLNDDMRRLLKKSKKLEL